MKFLVIEKHRETLTRDVMKNIAPAMFAYMRKMKQLGKMQNWVLAGMAGGAMLLDVESNEELAVILMNNPIYPYTTREIYALWEPEKAEGVLEALVKQMEELD